VTNFQLASPREIISAAAGPASVRQAPLRISSHFICYHDRRMSFALLVLSSIENPVEAIRRFSTFCVHSFFDGSWHPVQTVRAVAVTSQTL
jgi:hypothetical protein